MLENIIAEHNSNLERKENTAMREQEKRVEQLKAALIPYLDLLSRDELKIIYLLIRELARKNR